MDCIGDVGGGGGVDGRAVDEEAVGFCGDGLGDGGEAGVEYVAEDGFDVRGARQYGNDDALLREQGS